MQRASGDSNFPSYRPQTDEFYRRPNSYSTRRLSTAIDSLRREGEAILWELNSLMTQNLTLEQRLIGQTEELNRLSASLISLRDQHRTMEQQYRESLQALRSELNAAQREGQQPSASLSGHSNNRLPSQSTPHERHRSPSPPRSLDYASRRRSRQFFRPSTPPVTHGLRQRDNSPRNQNYNYPGDHKDSELPPNRDATGSPVPYSMQHRSFTPPSLRPVSSFDTPLPSNTRRLTSPQGKPPDDAPSPTRIEHEPSVSPTTTLIGSDGPSRSRQKITRG